MKATTTIQWSAALVLMLVLAATQLLASGTPYWWDNSYGYANWTQTVATGTMTNSGPQAQFLVARIDVPNNCCESAPKEVWVQVEWSVMFATGILKKSPGDATIMWMNDAASCPAGALDPYPNPPDGSGNLLYRGTFAPQFGFVYGDEFSFGPINLQPDCERLQFKFEAGSGANVFYRIEVQTLCACRDFGDAPDPGFPTLLVNNSASHIIVPGVFLGQGIDADPDGQPEAAALGDDMDGNNDDDGVVLTSEIKQGHTATVNVTASTMGYLNAWIDLNADGDWDDPGEHIFIDQPLVGGVNALSFYVPVTALPNTSGIGRFRFSSQRGLSYSGFAPDGEVEDYLVDVLIPVELASFTVTHRNGYVVLDWRTATETENLGFHIYRSESPDGPGEPVNRAIIAGAGTSTSEHRYRYTDDSMQAGKTYYYRLVDVGYDGSVRVLRTQSVLVPLPTVYALEQNYPNPFNPETRITFSLKESGAVSLTVYDLLGHRVVDLVSESLAAGSHAVTWDGRDQRGNQVASGTYFYAIEVNGFKAMRKMAFMK